jgi:glycosyltransferase involved in cell wall biosynthesis
VTRAIGDLHAISNYGPSASSTRVRLNDWFRFLEIDATNHYYAGLNNNRPGSIVANPAAVSRAEIALRRLDLAGQRVILSREASPFSQGGIEERLLHHAGHGVYDFDDALFEDQSAFRRLLRTQGKCRRATAAADVVIAGNAHLANWAEQYNRDVRVIPSCIDPRDYEPKTNWSITGDIPALIWLGSPATERYLAQIAPALLEVNRRTGALLILISGPNDNADLGLLNRMVRRIPWSLETFASAMAQADIAIAPLDDTPYSRGKCAYKLLQYAATGLPMIGSPVGANQLALKRFEGLEARTEDDWIQGMLQLVEDTPSQRAASGTTGRNAVRIHYSFDAWNTQWCEATGVTEADRSACLP